MIRNLYGAELHSAEQLWREQALSRTPSLVSLKWNNCVQFQAANYFTGYGFLQTLMSNKFKWLKIG
jgi:hypothetical protein